MIGFLRSDRNSVSAQNFHRQVLVASGAASEILEDALDADVSDVLLLPQLTDNVLFVVKKASHAKRAVPTVTRAQLGRVVTVFSRNRDAFGSFGRSEMMMWSRPNASSIARDSWSCFWLPVTVQ